MELNKRNLRARNEFSNNEKPPNKKGSSTVVMIDP